MPVAIFNLANPNIDQALLTMQSLFEQCKYGGRYVNCFEMLSRHMLIHVFMHVVVHVFIVDVFYMNLCMCVRTCPDR